VQVSWRVIDENRKLRKSILHTWGPLRFPKRSKELFSYRKKMSGFYQSQRMPGGSFHNVSIMRKANGGHA